MPPTVALVKSALSLSALLCFVCAWVAWRRRLVWGARSLAGLMLAGGVWALGYAVEISTLRPWLAFFAARVQYVGIAALPVYWLIFVLALTGVRIKSSAKVMAALFLLPSVTVILAWTSDLHRLLWTSYWYDTLGSPPAWVWEKGIWFWWHTSYSYLLILAGLGALFWESARQRGVFRLQAWAAIVAGAVPWLANLVSLFVMPHWSLDVTPLFLPVTGGMLLWALLRLRLLDLVPIARDAVMDNLTDAVVVLDRHERIVDANTAAYALWDAYGCTLSQGMGCAEAMAGPLEPLRRACDGGEVTLLLDEGVRRYDVGVVYLVLPRGGTVGRALVVRNVTAQWQARLAVAQARDGLEQRVRDRTVELVEALAERDREIENRRQVMESLQWRLELEAIVAQVSERFIRLAADQLDEAIEHALAQVGEFAGSDRAYLFQFRDGLATMDNTHEWCADGIEPQIAILQGLPSSIFPWWMEQLTNGHVIHVPNVTNMPSEAADERAILEQQQVQSVLVVPLIIGDRLVGFLGFDAVRQPRAWPQEDILVLETLAGVLVSGIERQVTESALRASEERYHSIFEAAPAMVLTVSVGGKIRDCNARSEDVFGIAPAELLGIAVTSLLHPDERDAWEGFAARLHEHGEATLARLRGLRVDGSTVELSARASLLVDAPNGETNALCLLSDESERRSLEQQLRQAQKMEAIGRLAGGVAHDFNNVLTVINLNSELAMASLPAEDPLRRDISEIRQAGGRAARLTRQLMAFSRSQELVPQPLDLGAVVDELAKMLQCLIGEDVRLVLELADGSSPVLADRGQIEQVIINLAVNARDAMPQGGRLTLRTEEVSLLGSPLAARLGLPEKVFARLTVEDTGEGMSDSVREHLFEPFFTTKGPGQGTGLGLATVYGIVAQSGGAVDVQSAVGVGSLFRVYLPTATVEPLQDLTQAAEVSEPRGTATILLLDDDSAVRHLATRVLREQGYQVYGAQSGREALELCDALSLAPDLVITDVVMPDVSGVDFVNELRERGLAQRVLYMSGYTADRLSHQGVPSDDANLLTKPLTGATLLKRVRQALG